MIWQTLVVALCFMHFTFADEFCVVQGDEHLSLSECNDPVLSNFALSQMRNFVCNIGKINQAGDCAIQPQCVSERTWLSGNLTICLNKLNGNYNWGYVNNLILFLIARVRTFYWQSGLPLQTPYLGIHRNGQIDRIMLFIPYEFQSIIERYVTMSNAEFTFPLPNSGHVRDMIVDILQTSCSTVFDQDQRAALISSLTVTDITHFGLAFLNGPLTENLKTRSGAYNNLFHRDLSENDFENMRGWWRNLLKVLTDSSKELMSGCPDLQVMNNQNLNVRAALREFVSNVTTANMATFRRCAAIQCHDSIMSRTSGGGGRSCSSSHGRSGGSVGLSRVFSNLRPGGNGQQWNSGGQGGWNMGGQGPGDSGRWMQRA